VQHSAGAEGKKCFFAAGGYQVESEGISGIKGIGSHLDVSGFRLVVTPFATQGV